MDRALKPHLAPRRKPARERSFRECSPTWWGWTATPEVDPDDIRNVRVVQTIKHGKPLYARPQQRGMDVAGRG